MYKQNLDSILVIDDFEDESVIGIVGRMEMLFEVLEPNANHSGFIPFLHTYQLVTKKVNQKYLIEKKFYENYPAIELLDVHFANLYFQPLRNYLTKKIVSSPWQTYYEYCDNGGNFPFVQLMLGINAHINGDLCSALHLCEYKSHKDFDRINNILEELVPQVMKFLAFTKIDFLGFGGLFWKNLVNKEFKKIVVRWRKDAWVNYQVLQKLSGQEFKDKQKEIHDKTELLGKEIITIFTNPLTYANPIGFLDKLHGLRVQIS